MLKSSLKQNLGQSHPSEPPEMRQPACGLALSSVKMSSRGPGSHVSSAGLCQGLQQSLLLLVYAERASRKAQHHRPAWGQSLRPDNLGMNQYNGHLSHQVWDRIGTDAQLSGGICQQSPASTSHHSECPGAHCVRKHWISQAGKPEKRQEWASSQLT